MKLLKKIQVLMDKEVLIQNITKEVDLSGDERKIVISKFSQRKYLKKQFVLQQGDVCNHLNFVSKGILRSYYVDKRGNDYNLQLAPEGWWITDFCSLYTGKPSYQNIETLEETEVIQISRDELDVLYKQVPAFERFFRILLQKSFITHEKRILYAISKTAEEKYQAFRDFYGELEQRIPQKQIASYLGMTPEFYSKVKSGYFKKQKSS
jgi:CRP/FNR family transcriptional regulator, anaerobic regulatory protein